MQINIPTRNIILITLIAIGAIIFVSAWFFATHLVTPSYVHRTPEQGLHPRNTSPFEVPRWGHALNNPLQDFGLAYTDVEFLAIDGTLLRGWLIPASDTSIKNTSVDDSHSRAVVAVHGGEGDRRSFMRHLPMLNKAGYAVLLFDYREHGISDGDSRGIAFGWRANHDVSSAVVFMKQRRLYSRVAVLGTSMGAVSAIIAGANTPEIDVVIAENPFASAEDVLGDADFFDQLPGWYRKLVAFFVRVHFDVLDEPNAMDVVNQISPIPILIMHGTADKAVSVWQSQKLYEKAGQPKELWILEGAEHTALFNKAPEEYEQRVIGFLDRYLGKKNTASSMK